MRKMALVLTILIIASTFVEVFAEESSKVSKSLLEDVVELATRPAKEVVGSVVDLGKIVISPYKVRESSFMSASSISVIDNADIASSQKMFFKDIVTEYAGVSMTQSGAFGGPATIRMRGCMANHTLLIMDGMKIYDSSTPDGSFDFAHLSLDNVEQIEITRGPQGTLYGSDAIGGIINIESKKPYKPFIEASVEAGSFRTLEERVNFGGYEKGLHYSFAYSQLNVRGISKADAVTIPDIHEVDPYVRKSLAAKLDYELYENLNVGATLRNVYAWYRYDDSNPITYALRDNDQLIGKSNFFLYSLYVEHKPIEAFDYSVRYAYLNNFRQDFDYPNGLSDWYDGRVVRFDYQNNFHILDYDIVTIGYDYTQELSDSYYFDFANGESDAPKVFARNSALYLQNKLHFKDIIGSTQSMRIDNHSQFGTHGTYKIDGFYLAPTGTKLRGVYSTAFKAPSLFQLHAPANAAWWFLGGNPNLQPENAKSYELGIEQYLFNKAVKLSATYFQIRFSNLIKFFTYDSGPLMYQSTYQNVSKAKSEGMEYGAEIDLLQGKLKISANLTSMETKDYSTDRDIARVPQNLFNIKVGLKPVDKLSVGAEINHTGRYFNVGTDKMKQFTLIRLTALYDVSNNFSFFGRVENVFNKHYERLRGYGEPGIAAYGGVKAKF